jgi:glycyl-tRNA synthetase beta chain
MVAKVTRRALRKRKRVMDFLFEIGLEEVPARMLAGAEAELLRRTVGMLERERLVGADVEARSYSTPRRLAVAVKGVLARQEDLQEEMLGPSAKIAFKDGVAGPAAVAFAKKAGVEVAALRTVTNAKGEYVAATSVKAGRAAAEVIAAELPKELAGIYWAKTMYWRAGRPERFVRPVRWIVALLGEEVVPVSFGGYVAGRVTFGHRVLAGPEPIELGSANEYVEKLTGGFVMAEAELRRHTIRKALDRVCRTAAGTRWREDHALVDKMTHMTEWPSVILGGFEPEYLELPEEVLVTVMRDHQNYFAVEDKRGKLSPNFLAVLNTVADAAGEAVIRHGNERVLRARFNDARFFWEFDQRVPLEERVGLLENVTFQKDLGSYRAKSERVRGVAVRLGALVMERGGEVDPAALEQAAVLAKADLTSELVKEFTELQGIVGGLYARAQGHSETVAAAIYDQYLPVSMEDRVPRTTEGALLAIADKADTIAGMFGLGLEPTGSKDPFALRRAANGIVKILAETWVGLGLGEIARAAAGENEELVRKIEVFFAERLEFYLREAKGQAYDVVKAVLAVRTNEVRDAVARAEAVTAVRGSADFEAVSAAFKRMTNILAQAAEKGIAAAEALDVALLQDGAELELASKAADLKPEVAALRAEANYRAALEAIATLRPQVDGFFDAVMVMDPDVTVRGNRLALLERVLGDFGGIAEFSDIVVAG